MLPPPFLRLAFFRGVVALSAVTVTQNLAAAETSTAPTRAQRVQPLARRQYEAMQRAVLERVLAVKRTGPKAPAPQWAKDVMRHHCDLARGALEDAISDRDLPRLARLYDVVHNKDFLGFRQWLPTLRDDLREELAQFLMGLQDPKTGHFRAGPFAEDPLYTVGMPSTHDENVICRVYLFGGAPKYPVACMPRQSILRPLAGGTMSYWDQHKRPHSWKWSEVDFTTPEGRMGFVAKRAADTLEWHHGPWGIGTHIGHSVCQLMIALENGHTEVIPYLEKAATGMYAHVNPATGIYPHHKAGWMNAMSGCTKGWNRTYGFLGLPFPYPQRMVDTLVDRDWIEAGCSPRNVAILIQFCLEQTDYRRQDLYRQLYNVAHTASKGYPSERHPHAKGPYEGFTQFQHELLALPIIAAWNILNWGGPDMIQRHAYGWDDRRGLPYRYKLVLQKDNQTVRVVKKRPEEFPWHPGFQWPMQREQ